MVAQESTDPVDDRPTPEVDPQRHVRGLNRFFRRIVGPAQVDNSRPGGYYVDETKRHERLAEMGLEMRTDASGHSYVVKKDAPES